MKNNNADLNSWVNEYTSDLYNWAYHKVSNGNLAEELVQDTFLAAAEGLSRFRAESSPKTWLFSILNYKIIDHYRKKSKMAPAVELDANDRFLSDGNWNDDRVPLEWEDVNDNLVDNSEFQTVLQQCMEALPDKWQASVKFKYLMKMKGEEICEELGITKANFWQIVHRAKMQLRDCVEVNWFKS